MIGGFGNFIPLIKKQQIMKHPGVEIATLINSSQKPVFTSPLFYLFTVAFMNFSG